MSMIPNNVLALSAAVMSVANVAYQGNLTLLGYVSPPIIEATAVAPETVRAGESVLVSWTVTKRTTCPGVNGRVWSGEKHFHLAEPFRPTGLPSADVPITYLIETKIPGLAPPGPLRLSIAGEYHCPGKQEQPFVLGPVEMEVIQ